MGVGPPPLNKCSHTLWSHPGADTYLYERKMSEVEIYIFQSEKVLSRKVVAQTKNIDILLQRRINTGQKVKDLKKIICIGV